MHNLIEFNSILTFFLESIIINSNFKRSDGCEANFRSDTTEHPLKMSGMVREGNRRGFLAIEKITTKTRKKDISHP